MGYVSLGLILDSCGFIRFFIGITEDSSIHFRKIGFLYDFFASIVCLSNFMYCYQVYIIIDEIDRFTYQ